MSSFYNVQGRHVIFREDARLAGGGGVKDVVEKNITAFQKVVAEANEKLAAVKTDGEAAIDSENKKIRSQLQSFIRMF